MDRAFLDANVLYSAAWRPALTGLRELWRLRDVTLLTSAYAISEAERNLTEPAQRIDLHQLVRALERVEPQGRQALPAHIDLPLKDRPILLAAIAGRATHLLTGDRKHFGRYFNQTIEGVLILPPGTYLAMRRSV